MNTNPLMPGGVEQKNQGRARVKIAVFFVLAVHVVVLGALLMQGCKRETEQPPTGDTNPPPVIEPTSLPLLPPPTGLLPVVVPTNPPPIETHIEPPAAGVTEYSVVKGDSFYTIAKKFHVPMKAIQDANPGVEPTKLQPNQKIKIPAPTAAPALQSPPGAAREESDASVYKVKSGDTLSDIARKHHTTVKALRSLNNLTTDKIKVGQQLKLPASPATAPAPTPDTTPVVPSPAPSTPAPAGTTPIR